MDIMKETHELEDAIKSFVPTMIHDEFAVATIKEAINAAKQGNFGVGAILVDIDTNEIVGRGYNKVFSESRSDLHAEMDVLNYFEDKYKEKSREKIKNLRMFTSLESCPMCLCRIITSGLMEVYHIADDINGGMVHLYHNLPSVWKEISSDRIFEKAKCSDALSEIALQVFLLTVELDKKLS